MKINELAALSGINAETIRMYRQKGLLHPRQLDNGYYDYSITQLKELMNIRKLRSEKLGLDMIIYNCTHDDLKGTVDALAQEHEALTEQIKELQRQQYMIKVTLDHLDYYLKNPGKVEVLEVEDDSYCLVLGDTPGENVREWFDHITLMTQSIIIPPEILTGGSLPTMIPYASGVGTYKHILEDNGIDIPPEAVSIPKGRYLTIWVIPEQENAVSCEQIQPLLDYAREKNYELTGHSTAFLYRVDTNKGRPKFVYRFRVRVKKAQG